ncbi:hypothetical protein RYZ26_04920 [Terasakiella sp. A23]|uniref:hypothetical protein n=1 Tax=Terasakiella sp. FCG-A23 TaxID=3080561 RepID=UPI00295514DD|nr:hypothetical protein [Terasakiella sp. A23]MDV7338921.1 hypothetical protein [Terasakiella sp. A23]
MSADQLKASHLIEKYGPQVSQQLLTDMLNSVQSEDEKQQIQQAVEELNILIQTDEKGTLRPVPTEIPKSLDRLPSAYKKGCMEIWLFDDAFISYNSLANYYHGYRKDGDRTMRLKADVVRKYREYIENPQKLLDL